MGTRQCPHCGREVFDQITQCPYCREAMRAMQRQNVDFGRDADGNMKIRNGLLCMLLGAVVHYFAAGYSAMVLPVPVSGLVSTYLSPLLLLSGVGLAVFGIYLKQTA
jgi:hypothetical protein